MFHLISLVGSGISYLINRREDKEKTEEHTDTQDTEDPVQTDSLLDPGLECEDETQTDSAVPQESVNEAEEKSQKVEESGSLLDDERSILEERVRELEELLCEREREYERKQEVTLAESKEKHKQVMESVEQMAKQDVDLKMLLDTLKDTLPYLGKMLNQKETECTDTIGLYEREVKLRKRVQSRYKQKEHKFKQETRSLMVALNEAERKYDQQMESKTQLEKENSTLWSDFSLIQVAMMELDEELSRTQLGHNEMRTECELNNLQSKQNEKEETSLKECEREKEPHSVLKVDQMTSTDYEELPKGTLAEALGLYFELSHRRDELKNEVNKLRELVQQLERELSESHKRCEEIKREYDKDKDKEYNSVLKCDQMTSTDLMELAQVSQPVDEYIAQLENETSDLRPQVTTLQDSLLEQSILLVKTHREYESEKERRELREDLLKLMMSLKKAHKKCLIRERKSFKESLHELEASCTEARKKKQRLVGTLSQRMNEHYLLKQNLESSSIQLSDSQSMLEQTTQELEQKTSRLTQIETDWKALCNEFVPKDLEDECRARQLLKVQYSEMKQQHDKLEEDHVRLREAYSTLKSQYEELKQHHESQMKCKREQEPHLVLNVQCHEMKEYSSHTEESGSVNRQQGSVQQLEEELTEIERKCDEMERERERRQNQFNLLKARCQQLEESLQECRELLKIRSPDL